MKTDLYAGEAIPYIFYADSTLFELVLNGYVYDPRLLVMYVVDAILMVVLIEEIENMLYLLNTRHPSVKFTCEIEKIDRIPYFDINFIINNDMTINGLIFIKKPRNRLFNWLIQKSRKSVRVSV